MSVGRRSLLDRKAKGHSVVDKDKGTKFIAWGYHADNWLIYWSFYVVFVILAKVNFMQILEWGKGNKNPISKFRIKI